MNWGLTDFHTGINICRDSKVNTFNTLVLFLVIHSLFVLLSGILRYQVDFQIMEPLDDLGTDFDLDDYWQTAKPSGREGRHGGHAAPVGAATRRGDSDDNDDAWRATVAPAVEQL